MMSFHNFQQLPQTMSHIHPEFPLISCHSASLLLSSYWIHFSCIIVPIISFSGHNEPENYESSLNVFHKSDAVKELNFNPVKKEL